MIELSIKKLAIIGGSLAAHINADKAHLYTTRLSAIVQARIASSSTTDIKDPEKLSKEINLRAYNHGLLVYQAIIITGMAVTVIELLTFVDTKIGIKKLINNPLDLPFIGLSTLFANKIVDQCTINLTLEKHYRTDAPDAKAQKKWKKFSENIKNRCLLKGIIIGLFTIIILNQPKSYSVLNLVFH